MRLDHKIEYSLLSLTIQKISEEKSLFFSKEQNYELISELKERNQTGNITFFVTTKYLSKYLRC